MTGALMRMLEPEIKEKEIKALTQGLIELAGWSEADAVKGTAKQFDVSVDYVNGILHPKAAV